MLGTLDAYLPVPIAATRAHVRSVSRSSTVATTTRMGMLGGSSGRVRRSSAMAGELPAWVEPRRSRSDPKSAGRVDGSTHQSMGTCRDTREICASGPQPATL